MLDSGLLGRESVGLLDRYVSLVERQAATQSLVASGDRDVLFTRHVIDSLNPLDLFGKAPTPSHTRSSDSGSTSPPSRAWPPQTALDVGSGAGFPGVPLAIAWPSTRVTLLESRERKAAFLERVVREIRLANVSVVCDRLELWAQSYKGRRFDAAFIRAVGDLPSLLQSLRQVCRPGGRWVYFMGEEREPSTVAGAYRAETFRGVFNGRLLSGVFDTTQP